MEMAHSSVTWGRRVLTRPKAPVPAWRANGEFRTFFEKSGRVFEARRMGTREHPYAALGQDLASLPRVSGVSDRASSSAQKSSSVHCSIAVTEKPYPPTEIKSSLRSSGTQSTIHDQENRLRIGDSTKWRPSCEKRGGRGKERGGLVADVDPASARFRREVGATASLISRSLLPAERRKASDAGPKRPLTAPRRL